MKVSTPVVPVPDAPAPAESVPPGSMEVSGPMPSESPVAIALAKWPEWFKPVDLALGILAVVLAFLLASYTARNSDIWRHMGTGRLLVQGHYPIGGDPLSFRSADRAWVNSNWLFDVVMYAAFSADDTGTTSVVLKALAFAAAFAVLFLLRKPDQSLWPWAALVALGAIASGSLASLRPHVFGVLLQSVVLVLIYRGNWAGSKWRMPAIFGAVCWIWACTDSFFLLGPLTLALVLVGERIHGKLMAGQPAPDGTDDPFWAAPPHEALVRGLLAGVAGALLNPMFLGALIRSPLDALGQLIPFELTFGWEDHFAGDTALIGLPLSPLSSQYFDNPERGDNVPGYCALALFLAGGLLLGVGFARLRATHLALWFGFIAFTLLHYRFIPFTAVVAIPLAAAQLNGLARFRLGGTFDPKTKMLLNLSGIGRILTVTVLILLIGETVPGHLHARISQTALAYNRRVSWGIEGDSGLARSAKLIAQWRSEGSLAPDSRALTSFYDFGDYCAWFAPRERVFLNSRFRFHRSELIDLAAIRRELRTKPGSGDATETASPLKAMADKHRADLYVLGQAYQRMRVQELVQVRTDFARGGVRNRSASSILHLDGRVSIIARIDTASGLAAAQKISFSPERDAFEPDSLVVPDGKAEAPKIAVESWIADYLDRPQVGSLSTDDAQLFVDLGKLTSSEADQLWMFNREMAIKSGWAAGPTIGFYFEPPPRSPGGEELAYPILANRAARRAISETPDDPEPYRFLAEAYALGAQAAANPDENLLQEMTARRRFLDRVPTASNRGDNLLRLAQDDTLTLFLMHLDAGQFDTALEMLTKANAKIKGAPEAELPSAEKMQNVSDAFRSRILELQFNLPRGSVRGIIGAPDGGIAEAITNFILGFAQSNGQRPGEADMKRLYTEILAKVTGTNLDAGAKVDKPKARDAAWVRSRTQLLEDRFKRDVGLRIERHSAGKPGLGQRFIDAANLGLTSRAIDSINAETDWSNVPQSSLDFRIPGQELQQMSQRYPILFGTAGAIQDGGGGFALIRATDMGLNLQAIQLQFLCGKLDVAVLDLNAIQTVLDKLEKDKPSDARVIPAQTAIKQLRTLQARLVGDYAGIAADAREQLQKLPKLTPATLAQFRIPFGELQAPMAVLCGTALLAPDPLGRQRAALAQESNLHFDLAVNALLAGDNREARTRFAMALNPQGVPLRTLNLPAGNPMATYAPLYLRLLDKHADTTKR